METLLHYVWKYKLYAPDTYQTVEGIDLEIIDPGMYNPDAGPDFFNAKIKLDGKIWAGNIEIHDYSSNWYKHKHDSDKAYNSVLLHVVAQVDAKEIRDESGRLIPQWILKVPERIQENYRYLLSRDHPVPCLSRISEIPEIYLSDWKNALLSERLERKTQTIFQLLDDYHNDWNEVFYIVLSRNFGFGINNDAFERLAKSLPLKYILKHSNSSKQVEAMFLGQASLLEDETGDDYYLFLQQEYRFLSKKYGLQKLENTFFKNLRIRPNNFPHVKIVQLAGFARNMQHLFSKILEAEDVKDFRSLFFSEVSAYWETHYHFGKTSGKKKKTLGKNAISILLINTAVPLLFAYGKKKGQDVFAEKAFDLLESIPAEDNSIVNLFSKGGIRIEHAGDSQALIQLKKEYCEQKKCIFCRIGHKLLSK
ncbi:MAG: DUF2851 family protein [Candidatus Azobacteroides sp.]|nr:DUF2851 family protein [Candidatus Azobacteroides sp.]